MSNWRSTVDDPPDWQEGGWCEIRRKDGSTFTGFIEFDVATGDDGEVPVPEVEIEGKFVSLFAFDAYRKIETKKPAG